MYQFSAPTVGRVYRIGDLGEVVFRAMWIHCLVPPIRFFFMKSNKRHLVIGWWIRLRKKGFGGRKLYDNSDLLRCFRSADSLTKAWLIGCFGKIKMQLQVSIVHLVVYTCPRLLSFLILQDMAAQICILQKLYFDPCDSGLDACFTNCVFISSFVWTCLIHTSMAKGWGCLSLYYYCVLEERCSNLQFWK